MSKHTGSSFILIVCAEAIVTNHPNAVDYLNAWRINLPKDQ